MREMDILFEEFFFDTLQGVRVVALEKRRRAGLRKSRSPSQKEVNNSNFKSLVKDKNYTSMWMFYLVFNFFRRGVFWAFPSNVFSSDRELEARGRALDKMREMESMIKNDDGFFHLHKVFDVKFQDKAADLIKILGETERFYGQFTEFVGYLDKFKYDFENTCMYREAYLGRQFDFSNKKVESFEENSSEKINNTVKTNFNIHSDLTVMSGNTLFMIEFKFFSSKQYIMRVIEKKYSLLTKKFFSGNRGDGPNVLKNSGIDSIVVMIVVPDNMFPGNVSLDEVDKRRAVLVSLRGRLQEKLSSDPYFSGRVEVLFVGAGDVVKAYSGVTRTLVDLMGGRYVGQDEDLDFVQKKIEDIDKKINDQKKNQFTYLEAEEDLRDIRSTICKVRYISSMYGSSKISGKIKNEDDYSFKNVDSEKDWGGRKLHEKEIVTASSAGWSHGYYNIVQNRILFETGKTGNNNYNSVYEKKYENFASYFSDTKAYNDVIVLMVDLSRFTEYSRMTRDEGFIRSCLVSFYSACRSSIVSNGGYLYRFVGDEVIAFFGIPEHKRFHNYAAVQAAFELMEIGDSTMNRWRRRINASIDTGDEDRGAKCGISMGRINVLPLRPFSHAHLTFAGDAINECSRMVGAAEVGSIIVSQSFYNALSPSEPYLQLTSLGPVEKGNGENKLDAYSLERVRWKPKLGERGIVEEPRKAKLLDCRYAIQDLYKIERN